MAQMRYPYTLGAMLTQFPLKFHIQKSWVWKVSNETISNARSLVILNDFCPLSCPLILSLNS